MKRSIAILALVILSSFVAVFAADDCNKFHSSSPAALISYLNETAPNPENSGCIASAIDKLGDLRYEPAIPVLMKFLEFRWPLDVRGRRGLDTRRLGIEDRYPAELALERFGDKALAQLLGQIRTGHGSRIEIESAVAVWMTYYEKDQVKGVALLKREADRSNQPYRGRLNYAAYFAQKMWCDQSLRTQCKAAALARYGNPENTENTGTDGKFPNFISL